MVDDFAPPTEPPVELCHVTKSYAGAVAVRDLSFSIARGQIFGLLGPNGAGKTSAIRMMIGITLPDSGEVRIFGMPPSRASQRRIGYLPEERGLYRRMTVAENLMFLARLRGLTAEDSRLSVSRWAARLELRSWLGQRVEELSKGMQQKVQFVAALIHDPGVVVMDEPFTGLDPLNTSELKDVLVELKSLGKSIVFSSHRMDQVEKLCDAICLMDHGRAILCGDLGEIRAGYGERFVHMEFDGDTLALRRHPLVESIDDYGSYLELRLRAGADSQALLRCALANGRVKRFEVREPSLEQIFIDAVRPR
ncbi:MAG TPA: ATP-binding cassette domain-containing protein [Candidatus Binataceae bacterium]|nr:ATP-binding cassette domain-containing protein [Candidatus Binataceae bacterium]